MRFWIIYILVQILFFGDCLGQCNFKTFLCQPTMLEDIFTPLPPPPSPFPQHKKAFYGPEYTYTCHTARIIFRDIKLLL